MSDGPGDAGEGEPVDGEDGGTDRHFGEQGGRLTYGSYLRLEQLLSAQVPETDPMAHDEWLFITIHQVYELWFAQLLHDLDAPHGTRWTDGRTVVGPAPAEARRRRSAASWSQQLEVLETMTPQDFLEVPHAAGAGERVPVRAVPRAGVPVRSQGPGVPAVASGG